jgi:hypothetical protein
VSKGSSELHPKQKSSRFLQQTATWEHVALDIPGRFFVLFKLEDNQRPTDTGRKDSWPMLNCQRCFRGGDKQKRFTKAGSYMIYSKNQKIYYTHSFGRVGSGASSQRSFYCFDSQSKLSKNEMALIYEN